jgi:hypothetical protein
MSQTHTETPALQTPVIPDPELKTSLWQRMGSSLLIFSLVLSGILMGSWAYVLPRLTAVKLQGKTVDLSVVIPYEQKLRAQIAEAESKRNRIVLPVKDEQFELLKRKALCYPQLQDLNEEISKVAKDVGENAVVFSGMTFDAAGTLSLSGDVRNVGPRSMTVLAEFVDDLKALPFVASATAPAFTRENDPTIGFHSPFSFTLNLKASDQCPIRG